MVIDGAVDAGAVHVGRDQETWARDYKAKSGSIGNLDLEWLHFTFP